jgi:hypothetical protein
MSEDFDDLLSGAVESAAGAARKPGAAVARKRGGQRRTRQRLAASTLAVALLGGVGSVAAVSLGHSGRTPTVTVTGTPSPSPSPTGSASTSPSPSLSPSPSMSPTRTQTQSSTPAWSQGTDTNTWPGTASSTGSVTSASENWLTASQLPFGSAMNWDAGSPNFCSGSSLIFAATYFGGCSEHTDPGAPHPATKMDTLIFSPSGAATPTSTSTGGTIWLAPVAVQTYYAYANAADAQSAYQYITQAIRDEDAQYKGSIAVNTGLPLVSTTTVTSQTADSIAMDDTLRDTHGNPADTDGNYGGYSDFHFFFAVKGDLIDVLQFSGGPSISDNSQDGSTLAAVVTALG